MIKEDIAYPHNNNLFSKDDLVALLDWFNKESRIPTFDVVAKRYFSAKLVKDAANNAPEVVLASLETPTTLYLSLGFAGQVHYYQVFVMPEAS